MKMIRGTLKLALILYICAALSGIYVLSASARITPHPEDDGTVLIEIEKGDTLWDLCQEHLKDPRRWRELSKYNDFSNPHLIYPGEKLRIPIEMAKDAMDKAQEDLVKQQEDLQNLRAELAESEATRDKLESEISGLNESMDTLKGQLKDLEDSLKSQKELMAAVTDSGNEIASGVKKALEATKTSILNDIAQLDEQLAGIDKMLEEHKMKAADTHKAIESIQADAKTLLTQVETNQKAINEVKMILEDAKGVHEEPSTSKRALAFLTTAAAGIGWFIMSTIGGRSGE